MKTTELALSEDMESYFNDLEDLAIKAYDVAKRARGKGYDPVQDVEIPMAEDLALRAQELTGVKNTAEKIRELSEKYDREEVSIHIAKEIANREEGSVKERLEDAVRIGLAVLTEGILVAPLEGIGGLDIKDNSDGTDYVELSFAGPIRSAGGTGQAMSVLIADVVRRELGIGSYKATSGEVQRFKEEIPLYKKARSLQYTPSAEEIEVIVKGCPISISGEGTEKEEVSGNRNLPRVDTNRIRGGACLVIAEGMSLKAQKLKKHVDKLNIEGWDFIDEYIERFATSKKDTEDEKKEGISPNFKYIKDTIAGRPVFGHPSVKGGFRLRYGRSRTIGLAALAVNPAVMYLTDEFMALGTQIKIERPGKAGTVTPCDTIEGPTVLFYDGAVKRVDSGEEAKKVSSKVKEVIDLGEILIPYGEFLENNHPLVPAAYCHEWWTQETGVELSEDEITPEKAIELCREDGHPLHPKYVYLWDYLSVPELRILRESIAEHSRIDDGLYVSNKDEIKKLLEDMCLPHEINDDEIYIELYRPFLFTLGIDEDSLEIGGDSQKEEPMEYLSELSGVPIRSKAPTTIGARMARPEKTKERKMNPPVHGLFPLGDAGGNQRLIDKAVEKGIIEVEVSARRCTKCGKSGAQIRCTCGGRREIIEQNLGNGGPKKQKLDMSGKYREALRNIGEGGNVRGVKGVKGLMTKEKTPEALEKAILRAKHNIWVFKDGTCRYDMTDLPVTHFKPDEIDLTIEKARELGYVKDIHGEPLQRPDQMLEIKPQDFIASKAAGTYLVKIAKFVDDLLKKYYDIDPFYEAERKEDMIGELVVGLAPHTSGGVLGRLIGFHNGKAGYAHPFFHAAKRRNCDGDEDCIMLLMDGLLNFSQRFLPEKRGGKMDAPLVLTTKINPDEIDSEAHNVDCLWKYPLEFYEKAMTYPNPKELVDMMDIVEDRLDTEGQYEGFGYTHETANISEGPIGSRYTRLNKMTEKMEAQLKVAEMIRAVDATDVVSRVIGSHFIPDLIGNLNKFCVQETRCTSCNRKYRRPPLSGKCQCEGNLTLTVHEGSVKKYLRTTIEMTERFDLPPYLKQRIEQLELQINSLFDNDKVSTPSLDEFC
ncbi:MAG: DNA polymerase II large subunit [Candidatus Saliniplasma sp.]